MRGFSRVIGEPYGGDTGHHAEDRHEHCACIFQQQQAADDERGDAGECRQAVPIQSPCADHPPHALKIDDDFLYQLLGVSRASARAAS